VAGEGANFSGCCFYRGFHPPSQSYLGADGFAELLGGGGHKIIFTFLKKDIDTLSKASDSHTVMKNQPYKFNSLENARTFAARCEKAMGILMGDDLKYWVVTLADFERGIRAGYEPTK